jgi:hypothetical protein
VGSRPDLTVFGFNLYDFFNYLYSIGYVENTIRYILYSAEKFLRIYFFEKNDDFDLMVQMYLDMDSSLFSDLDTTNSIILKNTINTLFFDIKTNFYRSDSVDIFDIIVVNSKSEIGNYFEDLSSLISDGGILDSIPVFFTKNIVSLAYGEVPEFGIFSDLVLY